MKKVFCVVVVYVFLEVSINSFLVCSRRHSNIYFNSYCTVSKQIITSDATTSSQSKIAGSITLESIEKESNTNVYCKIVRGKAGSLPEFEKPYIFPDFIPREVLGETSSLFIHMFEFGRPNVFTIPEVSPVILVEDDENFTDELSSYGSYDDNHTSHETGYDTTVDFDLEEILDFDEQGDGNETSSDETWHMEMEDYSGDTSETVSREGTDLTESDDGSESCCDCCRDSSENVEADAEYDKTGDSENGDDRETEETETAKSGSESADSENENAGSENKNTDNKNENTESQKENTDSENESTDSEHETDSGDEETESDDDNSENVKADSERSSDLTKNDDRASATGHDHLGSVTNHIEIDTSASNTVLEGSSDEEHNLQDILITADCAHVDMKLYIDENQLQPSIEPKHQHVWSDGHFDALQSHFIRDTIRTPGRKFMDSLLQLSRFGNIPNTYVGRLF